MKKLSLEKRAMLVGLLVEGNSIRATSRLSGVAFQSVINFVADIGRACTDYQDKTIQNIQVQRIEADEIWAFCYSKQKNVPEEKRGQFGFGDVWTWVALDADTKLAISWLVGDRDTSTASVFIKDIAGRLTNRVQLTTDGHKAYLQAVEDAFGGEIDYAMLEKVYGASPEAEKRYSPPECIGCKRHVVAGEPDFSKVSTSYSERQNLTMRMSMRRFTRLTNGFSKKVENHAHSVALHFMWYNFGRIHQTLRCTPAMEAGISDHAWTYADVAALVDSLDKFQPKKRGPYKKRISE